MHFVGLVKNSVQFLVQGNFALSVHAIDMDITVYIYGLYLYSLNDDAQGELFRTSCRNHLILSMHAYATGKDLTECSLGRPQTF